MNKMALFKTELDILWVKRQYHIYFFSLFYKSQSQFLWIFTYRKRVTLHNVIKLIKSLVNRDNNHCNYKIFLEKCSYQLTKK